MKTINVEMLAFGEDNQLREVDVPLNEISELNESQILDVVYRLGQNDFQAKPCPSVSVGDVIHLNDKLFIVCNMGFKDITKEQLEEYKLCPRRDRSFHTLVRGE